MARCALNAFRDDGARERFLKHYEGTQKQSRMKMQKECSLELSTTEVYSLFCLEIISEPVCENGAYQSAYKIWLIS